MTYPIFKVANILSHCFIPGFIRPNGMVIDCGSNNGDFSRWISRHTDANVHGFEADPDLHAKLPKLDRVQFHNLAIDGNSGFLELHRAEGFCSSGHYDNKITALETVTVPKISFTEFYQQNQLGIIDLLKLDIEGCELNLFEKTPDEILLNISQITVEFHDFIDPNDLPRIHAISQRLQNIGFRQIKFSRGCWANCLFVNTKLNSFGPVDSMIALSKGWLISSLKRRLTGNSDNIS